MDHNPLDRQDGILPKGPLWKKTESHKEINVDSSPGTVSIVL